MYACMHACVYRDVGWLDALRRCGEAIQLLKVRSDSTFKSEKRLVYNVCFLRLYEFDTYICMYVCMHACIEMWAG